jgi:leucyl aminopeptidase
MFMTMRMLACAALMLASASAAAAQPYRGAAPAPAVQRPVVFAAEPAAPGGALVLPLAGEADLAVRGAMLAEADLAAVARALAAEDFRYGARQTLSLRGIGAWDRILIVGLGEAPSAADYQQAGAVAGRALLSEAAPVTLAAGGLAADAVSELAAGMGIGEYRSDSFQAARRQAAALQPTTVIADAPAQLEAEYRRRGRPLIEAMAWTRDVSNQPANVIYPESFVESARREFAGLAGVTIQVLDVAAMERLGMGAITGVGRGSERPPRMLIVRYRGQGAPAGRPIVLAGKGITFDTGGISIKPNAGMGNMRMDMSGAASVTGAVLALARARAPVHVVAIAALAENMPDGRAIRPGDVLTAMNGTTIEIVSTDAEGRLVLADALAYAEARLDPAVVVDVATLTGAVRGALGDEYAGLFTRHDALAEQLQAAGEAVGEPLWRLPLHDSYARDTASTYADIRNSGGDAGARAGTGAYFIGEFLSRDIPWAHLDIANMAWSSANEWKPDGSAGYAVRLLERFVRDWRPIPRGEGQGGQ